VESAALLSAELGGAGLKYAYEDLYPQQFEHLVVLICQELLGVAVQGFADGPDGGRDARFEGTAQLHPSTSAPWSGKTIIQAKHTNGFNRAFGETDFFSLSSETTVLGEEIPKIAKLKVDGDLDHYMLFANRRLTAGLEVAIREKISGDTGVATGSIYICGLEQLELWLKRFDKIALMLDMDPIDSPLLITPDDLAEIVAAFAAQRAFILTSIDNAPVARTSLAKKNSINHMSDDYSAHLWQVLRRDESVIRAFLADPRNDEYLELYMSTVEEIQAKIIAKRKDYQSFDEVMIYLLDMLYSRDPVLKQKPHKRLTRSLLYYMYWDCDIGRSEDVA
jgi:hypothetical protein